MSSIHLRTVMVDFSNYEGRAEWGFNDGSFPIDPSKTEYGSMINSVSASFPSNVICATVALQGFNLASHGFSPNGGNLFESIEARFVNVQCEGAAVNFDAHMEFFIGADASLTQQCIKASNCYMQGLVFAECE